MRCGKKHQKYNHAVADNSTIMVVNNYNVVSITLVHSVTCHIVVTYLNTLSNDARIYVIIRFNITFLAFSDEIVNSDIMSHDTSLVVFHTSTLYNSCSCLSCGGFGFRRFWVVFIITVSLNLI